MVVSIPESPCFRTLFGNQSVRGPQTLLKSPWQHVYPNFPAIQDKLSQKTSPLVRSEMLALFFAFRQYTQFTNFAHFSKKHQLHTLNILVVIDSEKCGRLNARKLLFQNTLGESKYSRVTNTGEICAGARLLLFSINPQQIKSENISFSQIINLWTVW